jgi:hypothetical protein
MGHQNPDFDFDDTGHFMQGLYVLYFWPRQNQRMAAAQRPCARFRKFSGGNSCIARARRAARAGLTVYPPSRTLELLAFYEYCRFVTFAFF